MAGSSEHRNKVALAALLALAVAFTVWMGSITSGPSNSSGEAAGGFDEPPSPDDASGPAVRAYYERLGEGDRPVGGEGPGEPEVTTTPTTEGESPSTTIAPPTATDLLLESINAGDPKWVGVMTEGGQESEIDDFATNAGRQPDLVQIAIGWESDGFDPKIIDRVIDRGSVLMISWEPWDHSQKVQPQDQPKYALANILAGDFDDYIDEWASGLAADGRPVLLRFAHEMNGNWYPWDEGVNGNAPGSYVAAWYYVQQRFADAGADNVLWVWSPNVAYPGSQPVAELFPGQNAVDVLGLVGYFGHFTTTPEKFPTFDELYGPTLAAMKPLSSLPVLITEASSTEVGGFKADWTTDFLAEVARRDDISGFVWFDVVKEADWRINSSPEAQAAFVAGLANPAYGG